MTAGRRAFSVWAMSSQSSACSVLAPDWAFVLQLHEGTALVAGQLQGRIEHVTSGQADVFYSIDQALEFIRRVLSQPVAPRP